MSKLAFLQKWKEIQSALGHQYMKNLSSNFNFLHSMKNVCFLE